MELIVCVGDHCHLNGSEMVVRRFQELLRDEGLGDRVILKGSFCLGDCSPRDEVAVRLGDEVLYTRYQDAESCFREQVVPRLSTGREGDQASPTGER